MTNYVIETHDLTKKYGSQVSVSHLNIHVKRGRIYGLLGRNGAGKTTTMRMLLGLTAPTSGEVSIFGKSFVGNEKKLLPRIGSLIESPGFYPNLTATENLKIFAELRGLKNPNYIKGALELVNLPYRDKKLFSQYSLGMKQRLAIALAVMHDPELLILDEPINGLDPIGIAEVRDFIRELCDARGKTILISSHILSEISLLADDVGIIDHGTLLTLIWALVPLVNVYQFLTCPIERLVEDGEGLPLRKLLRLPLLWMMLLLMICSGASEATMAQWASAFTESALGVSKTVGDLAGPCLFAAFMGISRILYGKMSEKLNLTKTMLLSGLLCVACYLLAALSPLPVFGLAGCALCGFSVGIMWPGTISLSSQKCPKGGTAMFAFLALAGDLGATVSPAMVGSFSEMAGGNLKIGLLAATIFPIFLVIGLLVLNRRMRSSL